MKTQFVQIDADTREYNLINGPLKGLLGTEFNLGIIFVRDGLTIMFPTDPNPVPGMISIKKKSAPSGPAMFFLGDWVVKTDHYLFTLSFNNAGLAAELGNAESLSMSAAVRWQPQETLDAHVMRCYDIPLTIYNTTSRSDDYQPE